MARQRKCDPAADLDGHRKGQGLVRAFDASWKCKAQLALFLNGQMECYKGLTRVLESIKGNNPQPMF